MADLQHTSLQNKQPENVAAYGFKRETFSDIARFLPFLYFLLPFPTVKLSIFAPPINYYASEIQTHSS